MVSIPIIYATSLGKGKSRRRSRSELAKIGQSHLRSSFPWSNNSLIMISSTNENPKEVMRRLERMRKYCLRNGVPEEDCQIRHASYLPSPSTEMVLYVMIARDKGAWDRIRCQCSRESLQIAKKGGKIPGPNPHDFLRELLEGEEGMPEQ